MQRSLPQLVLWIEPKISDIEGYFWLNLPNFVKKNALKLRKNGFSEDDNSLGKTVSGTANAGELPTASYLH